MREKKTIVLIKPYERTPPFASLSLAIERLPLDRLDRGKPMECAGGGATSPATLASESLSLVNDQGKDRAGGKLGSRLS